MPLAQDPGSHPMGFGVPVHGILAPRPPRPMDGRRRIVRDHLRAMSYLDLLQLLLAEFGDVFDNPSGLLPS